MGVYYINLKKLFTIIFWTFIVLIVLLFGFKAALWLVFWVLFTVFVILPLLIFLLFLVLRWYLGRKFTKAFKFKKKPKKKIDDAIDVEAREVK